MKNQKLFLAIALATFCCFPAFSTMTNAEPPIAEESVPAPENKRVETKISRVIVFIDGARVTRSAQVELNAGEQEIVFANVPANAEFLSARTTIAGARIISATPKELFRTAGEENNSDATREKLDLAIARENSLKNRLNDALARQKEMLSVDTFFPKNGNAETEFNVGTALDILAFQRAENARISEEIIRLTKDLENARVAREIVESEFSFAEKSKCVLENVVAVKFFSEQAATGTVSLDFVSSEARWEPRYELRIDDETAAVELASFGIVEQRTGEEWRGVPVELSTASAFRSTELPTFHKILITEKFENTEAVQAKSALTFRGNAQRKSRGNGNQIFAGTPLFDECGGISIFLKNGEKIEVASGVRYLNDKYIFKNADGVIASVPAKDISSISQERIETTPAKLAGKSRQNLAEILQGMDFRFDVNGTRSIDGDGVAARCAISSLKISGDFYLRIVPEKRKLAYRMMRIKNASEIPVLAGTAEIFYGNDFVGSMRVPFTESGATIEIPLGVDPRISVERSRVNAIKTVGTFSSSRQTEVSVLTKIKNHTPKAVRIECAESVPVSVREEIEVSEPKFSPQASFEKSTGIAEWNEIIAPNAELELRANYKIDYPENFSIKETSR